MECSVLKRENSVANVFVGNKMLPYPWGGVVAGNGGRKICILPALVTLSSGGC